jgi:predicted membrane-bound mannosyltransferase
LKGGGRFLAAGLAVLAAAAAMRLWDLGNPVPGF